MFSFSFKKPVGPVVFSNSSKLSVFSGKFVNSESIKDVVAVMETKK